MIIGGNNTQNQDTNTNTNTLYGILPEANKAIEQAKKTVENGTLQVSDDLKEQANKLKQSFSEMVPKFNKTNEELENNLKSLFKQVQEMKANNPESSTKPKLGDIEIVNEWKSENAALVVLTKEMILTQLYMNYLKYFRNILLLIRDNVLPNYNDIKQAKNANEEILKQLEGVLNDEKVQEKWNTILKTIALQSSRFIFIVTMFSDILIQKLGDVGNRFIVEFVNTNSDMIMKTITNALKGIPIVGSGVATADSLFNTVNSILNLGLVTSYSVLDGAAIGTDAVLMKTKMDNIVNEVQEKTQKEIFDLREQVNNVKEQQKQEKQEEEEEQPVPPSPDQGSPAPAQQGNAKKKKHSKKKKPKKIKHSKKKKQSQRKKKKKTQKRKQKK